MFLYWKRIFLSVTSAILLVGCASTAPLQHAVVHIPLAETTLKLDVKNNDQLAIGEFLLLNSDEGYVSIQVLSAEEEIELWDITTQEYLDQLYGTRKPENQDIVQAKLVLSESVVSTDYLEHESYFAIYQKEQDGRERIFFTDKNEQSSTYYILETEGKDSRKIFYGEINDNKRGR
ncbi:hypothetical protein [Neptuniibacter sp. QD48_11]|uniref:hypothetical protein n=1 Tax=unclassified Neptuniibacter TaxID=2630693 RepID=UPI0039F5828C